MLFAKNLAAAFPRDFLYRSRFSLAIRNCIGTAGKIGDDIVKIRYLLVGFMSISEPTIFVCLQSGCRKQERATTTAQSEVKIILAWSR